MTAMVWRFCLLLPLFSNAVEAVPVTFNTALPVSQGEFILREQLTTSKSHKAGINHTDKSIVSTLVYGLTPEVALFGTIPFIDRAIETNDFSRSTQDIGDSKLFGRYTVYRNDFKGGTFRIAPFAGIKIPTGNDNERDDVGLLPVNIQTGTGSWDMFGGLVATYGSVDWEVDMQLSYQNNTKANRFEAGDIARADASLQYRLLPGRLRANTDYFISGVLEVNLIHKNNNKIDDINDPNSGGATLFISPGIQYASERWIIEGSIQIPVIQDLNGEGFKNDYIARVGLRVNY